MDTAATKLLESATIKTLHAHNFSRSSTQSTLVLTDLLARYFALLSESSAKYAHHAGRTSLTAHDALAALEELGVGIEELAEYGSIEAKELNRYAQHSVRRTEDLNEFKAQLASGLRQDRDDAVLLEFRRYESPPVVSELEDEDVDMDGELDDVAMIVDSEMMRSPSPLERKTPPPRPSTPPLPLSPISNPSSPSRKRARTEHWKSPSHIPAFLPPFPSIAADSSTSIPPSPRDPQLPEAQSTELMPPPPDPKPVVPVTQAMTASAASDYLVQVPYSQSSLSSVPEWHLPTLPPSSSKAQQQPRKQLALPTLQTEPALFKAYHHVLTHRPSNTPPPSTLSRHKVAMAFLSQTQNNPRWDSADTLFSTVAPCPPRVAVIGPSYPVTIADPINVKIDPKDKDFRFPPTIPRPVSTTERLTPLLGQQSNRVPELSRHVLPPVVMNRITRLAHPPVLTRGTKPLLYGRGIPAPWNSHAIPPTESNGVPGTPLAAKHKDKEKDKDGENGDVPSKPFLPDAQLLATWDFDTKDYKVPLPSSSSLPILSSHPLRHHRSRVGSVHGSGIAGSSSGGVISLAATRSRSGSKLG